MKNPIAKIMHRLFPKHLCENVNGTNFRKNCLLLYIVRPFLEASPSAGHQNQWQAKELARIVGEFGYNVDVVEFSARAVKLTKTYDLVIDAHPRKNNVYSEHLSPGSKKIAYITGSNPSFSNAAEQERLEQLRQRRGVRLKQRRWVPPFEKDELQSFDALFFLGNSYNVRTYSEFELKRVYYIRNTGYTQAGEVNLSRKSPRDFMFLSGYGQVHKGLDLLLEVFARNPDINLYVCSSFREEQDFCRLYRTELRRTKNIKAVGFMDIRSRSFLSLAERCSYLLLPSCSEANAGSVLTGMSFGLIPLVTRECGFEQDEVTYLEDCSVEGIEKVVRALSAAPIGTIREQAVRTRKVIEERYGEKEYSHSVKEALKDLLS